MMELAGGKMAGTLGREVISTRQRKIAELAQREPKLTLTTLAHHIDDEWMREAYRRVRKDAAAGVDGGDGGALRGRAGGEPDESSRVRDGVIRRAIGREIGQWCRKHRHWPVREQWAALSRKLRGHYAYYGIIGNYQALHRFRWETARRWHTWLNRRHRRRCMTWERFWRLSHTYPLPPARVVRSVYR